VTKPIQLRSWATPLTMGAFLLMSATGALMFFGWDRALTAEAHKWFSLFFLLGAGGHITANVLPSLNHVKSRWGKTSIAVFTIVLAASFFSWGLITGPQLERPIKRTLVDAPLSALAAVTDTAPDALLLNLKAHGIVATGQQSVHDLSAEYHVDENRLLAIVFLRR
jgi:hypothetical protein